MVAYAIALIVNFKSVKEQSKKIKEYGSNAMVMTVTLFAVGIFMGVIKDSGMVEAMAETIVTAHALVHGTLLRTAPDDPWNGCLLLRTSPDHYRRSTAVRHHAGNGSGNLPFISHNGNSDQPVRCSRIRGPRSCRCLHQ